MGNYPVGKLIAETRRRKGLSQEEMAAGICTPSTLSKIENGLRMPRRRVYLALLQRVGLSHRCCQIYVSKVEMHRSVLEVRIEQFIAREQYREAFETLVEYSICGGGFEYGRRYLRKRLDNFALNLGIEPLEGEEGEYATTWAVLRHLAKTELRDGNRDGISNLELQFAMFQLGILYEKGRGEKEAALTLMREAILMTMGDYTEEYLKKVSFYTKEEMLILSRMAVISYEEGQRTYAQGVLSLLLKYTEEVWIDQEDRADVEPTLLYYLALWMGNDERVEEQIKLCDQGIELCRMSRQITMLPQLMSLKGCVLAEQGNERKAGQCLKQAYLLLQLLGESAEADALLIKARKLYQIEASTV